jgi:hypothetical protein
METRVLRGVDTASEDHGDCGGVVCRAAGTVMELLARKAGRPIVCLRDSASWAPGLAAGGAVSGDAVVLAGWGCRGEALEQGERGRAGCYCCLVVSRINGGGLGSAR